MNSENCFGSLLQKLRDLDESKNADRIGKGLNRHFDTEISRIVKQWNEDEAISDEDRQFIDLYSKLELYLVQCYFFGSESPTNDDELHGILLSCIFRRNTLAVLTEVVQCVRDERKSEDYTKESTRDNMLNYFMRMVDARAFARRLYTGKIIGAEEFAEEITACLTCQKAKDFIDSIVVKQNEKKPVVISTRHKFFVGCCTFGAALFCNKEEIRFSPTGDHRKLVFMFVKYIRALLGQINFEHNSTIIYCLRGVLSLLTNYISIDEWIPIVNKALENPDDTIAQMKNPFNTDLFASLIDKLLNSDYIRIETQKCVLKDITSLVDVAVIFLNKWCGALRNGNADNDTTDSLTEQNHVLDLLRSHSVAGEKSTTAQVLAAYTVAKYDRLQLMTVATLSFIMNHEDYTKLENRYPDLPRDIVNLIFDFIGKTEKDASNSYKGISFALLLQYLFQFLAQDTVKKQMDSHIRTVIRLCKERHIDALRILRRICSSTEMAQKLGENNEVTQFLKMEAPSLFESNPTMKKILDDINEIMFPKLVEVAPISSDTETSQVFISYCHQQKVLCESLKQLLTKNLLFDTIWIDRDYMAGDIIHTITSNIRASQAVFALLSEGYCNSDYCRREWNFANKCKKKVFYIAAKGFSPSKYDWTAFIVGTEHYYKKETQSDEERLLMGLKEYLCVRRASSTKTIQKIAEMLPVVQAQSAPPGMLTNWNTKPIVEWTLADIHQWCYEKHLEKWCNVLSHYHGRALLALHGVLMANTKLENLQFGSEIMLTDIVLFKYELDQIVTERMQEEKVL